MPSIMTLQGPRLAEFTCLSGECGTLQGVGSDFADLLKDRWLLAGATLLVGGYFALYLPTLKRRGLKGATHPRRRRKRR